MKKIPLSAIIEVFWDLQEKDRLLRPYPPSFPKHIPVDYVKYEAEKGNHPERNIRGDVGSSVHTVAESIDHIEDRIRFRYHLPNGRKHGDRIKYSSKIGKGCQYEVGYDRNSVETLGHETVQESYKREKKGSQERKKDSQKRVHERNVRKKESDSEHENSGQKPPKNPSSDESEYDNRIRCRRDEYLLDIFLKFGHVERRDRIGKRVRDNGHHDETWHDEFHVRLTSDGSELGSDKLTEYHVVESGRDNGWDERLGPDPEKSRDLFSDDGPVRDEKCAWRHAMSWCCG